MPETMSMRLNGKETTFLKFYYEDEETCAWHMYSVFSGASEHKNNPQSTHLKGEGPLPKGQYYVVDRPTGGKQDWIRKNIRDFDGKTKWFGLFRKDGNIGDETVIKGVRRGQFRMHPGGRSAGCVTFVHEKDFNEVRKMLLSTSKKKIPGLSTEYYAILIVE